MSRRIRRTPFTNKVEEFGVTGFTVVNHMLLPKAFKKTVEEDYWHLKSNVQLWDVSCQRQVQIEGSDAETLVQKMTPRLITDMKVGQCLYVPLIDENAGMINDPVLLKLDERKFWLSIADSDILLWAKGIALGSNLNVKINEPNIYPLAIQGPKAEDLLVNIFGEKIKEIKFYNFGLFDFKGTQQVIARAGYSKQGGFEIFFNGYELGESLWDTIWKAGEKFNIFGEGGGEALSEKFGLPLLAKIPISEDTNNKADGGIPLINQKNNSSTKLAIEKLVKDIAIKLPPVVDETCTGRLAKVFEELSK